MERIGEHEVRFLELSHTTSFIMSIENKDFLDIDERLFCLYFNIEVNPLLLVEKRNLMRTWFL